MSMQEKSGGFTKNLGRGSIEPRMGADGSAGLTTDRKQTKRIILFESEPEAHASESMTLCVYPRNPWLNSFLSAFSAPPREESSIVLVWVAGKALAVKSAVGP
jgi:hypothetical protein